MNLETFIKGSEFCLGSIIYTVDDVFYFQNNISDFSIESWEAPFMNFSKLVAGNFSSSLTDCEVFVSNFIQFFLNRYEFFNNNVIDFFMAFLFNLMGKAVKIKNIFDEVNDDIKNRYYADVAKQYGRLIAAVFLDYELSDLIKATVTTDIGYKTTHGWKRSSMAENE
jgi:hypothetical protein